MKKPGIVCYLSTNPHWDNAAAQQVSTVKELSKVLFLNYSPARSTYQQHHDKGSRTLKGSGNYNCHPLKISLNNGEGQNNNTVVSLPLNHRLADSAHDERGDRRRNTAARPKKPAERPKARGRRKEIRS